MFTRLRAFVARLRFAWGVSLSCPWLLSLARLTGSDVYQGAEYGVKKAGLDVSLKGAQNEHLRREAIEWAGHWYREHGVTPHPWDVRMCVELSVGHLKGYLGDPQ